MHEVALLCTSWPQERGGNRFCGHHKSCELVGLNTIYMYMRSRMCVWSFYN